MSDSENKLFGFPIVESNDLPQTAPPIFLDVKCFWVGLIHLHQGVKSKEAEYAESVIDSSILSSEIVLDE